ALSTSHPFDDGFLQHPAYATGRLVGIFLAFHHRDNVLWRRIHDFVFLFIKRGPEERPLRDSQLFAFLWQRICRGAVLPGQQPQLTVQLGVHRDVGSEFVHGSDGHKLRGVLEDADLHLPGLHPVQLAQRPWDAVCVFDNSDPALGHYAHLTYGSNSMAACCGMPCRPPSDQWTRICSTWRIWASTGCPMDCILFAAMMRQAASMSCGKSLVSPGSAAACAGVT